MLSLIAIVTGVIVILLEIFAAPIASILGDFEDPALQLVLQRCLQLITPSVMLFGLSGGVTGLLYSMKRFSITTLSGAVFNLGIVLAAPLLANRIGVYALPIGVAAGSLMQLAVMSPGLRGLGLHPSLAWNHPGVRRILHLYVPIALGLLVTQFQIIVDGRWASATGAPSVSWMRYSTTLIQMPLGLVPVAISLAALPSLAHALRAPIGRGSGLYSARPANARCPIVSRYSRSIRAGDAGHQPAFPTRQLHGYRHNDDYGSSSVPAWAALRRG